jgi:hypothetical protein
MTVSMVSHRRLRSTLMVSLRTLRSTAACSLALATPAAP